MTHPDWPDTGVFDPSHPGYEAMIAAASVRVHAVLRFLTRDPHDVDNAAQDAFLAFTKHRERVVGEARSQAAAGDAAHVFFLVCGYLITAAKRALARHQQQRRRLVTGQEQPVDRELPPNLGAALDVEAARELVRQEMEAADDLARTIIEGQLEGVSHEELAARLGLPSANASTIRHTRAKAKLRHSTRLLDAHRTLAHARQAHYGGDGAQGREPIVVAVATASGAAHKLAVQVENLQWHADGFLRGTLVLHAEAALPDTTPALAMVRGNPGDPGTHAAAEPFVLLWSDGPNGRTATFSAYLGPRVWVRPVPFRLPADAVQFVFAA